MEKIKDELHSYFKLIKENLNVIIIVPTIFGGIWQLIELSSMSTSFIRFFSISQLVPDGLLMLFIFFIIYFAYRIGISLFKKGHFNTDKKPSPIAGLFLIISTFVCIFIIFVPFIGEIMGRKNIAIYELFFLIPFTIIIIGIFLLGIFEILGFLILKFEKQFRKSFKWLIKIPNIKEKLSSLFTIIALGLILFGLKFILIDLHPYYSNFKKSILIPENLANKSYLEKKIKNDFSLKAPPFLLYFNDKYLFYQIYLEKEEKILVIDFNEIIRSTPKNL